MVSNVDRAKRAIVTLLNQLANAIDVFGLGGSLDLVEDPAGCSFLNSANSFAGAGDDSGPNASAFATRAPGKLVRQSKSYGD